MADPSPRRRFDAEAWRRRLGEGWAGGRSRARGYYDWALVNDPVTAGFRRPGKPEKTAAGIALALVLAVAVFLLLFDWNWLRGPIGRWASAKYDREIVLAGDLDVNLFSWTPSVSVQALRIGGPDWAREQDTLRVGQIEASARLRKLLAGQIEVPALTVTRPDAVLIIDEEGRQSWALDPDRTDDSGENLPAIQRLTIREGRLRFEERGRDLTLDARIDARETAEGFEEDGERVGFRLIGEGSLNGEPLELRVRGAPFINVRRDRPYAFRAELSGAGTTVSADGAITRPFDLRRFTADLTLEGRDLNDLYLITGIAAPNTPPYRLAGKLERNRDRWTFNDFSGRVGSSDLGGDMSVDRVNDRLFVEADLASRALDIDDLATVLGARPQVTPSGTVASSGSPTRLLPDAPLQADRLRQMDGRLSYRAASVKRNDFEIREVELGAALDQGILNLDPVAFAFNRGTLRGTARINATRDVPYSNVDFRLAGYPLESIVPARDGAPTVTGVALGRARLEGPGASLHDLASNADGNLSLVVPQGQMRRAFAELLGINVSAGLLRLFSGDRSVTPIRCGVADFTVQNGTATARTLVIDTDVVLTQGTGTINLESETLNLRLDGETKQPRLLRAWAPITVRGSLVSPQVGVDTSELVTQGGLASALGALVNPLVALLPFVDPGLAEDANCGALIASAR